MEALDSLVIRCARQAAVPAGDALAMDRDVFSRLVTEALAARPEIALVREEVTEIPPEGHVVIATGPLTSAALDRAIGGLLGTADLYFYDSIAPIVTASSLDFSKMYALSRYGKGAGADYWNAPLSREQYEQFIADLLSAEISPVKDFEKGIYFEGCLPIEVMAERGPETLRHGPMKPMGLPDPRTGKPPVRGRAAATGRPRRRALQPGRFPDEAEGARAAACLPEDPGARERRLRALRHAAPQHLHPRARAPGPLLENAPGAADRLCGADHGGRGLRRERGDGSGGGDDARAGAGGTAAAADSVHDGDRVARAPLLGAAGRPRSSSR